MGTTAQEVIKLFPNDELFDHDVSDHVKDANLLVGEVIPASSLSTERKDIIAKYLAAHLFVLAKHEGGIFEETIGESSEKRGSTFTLGQGLKLTRWGQMVLSLDSTGSFQDDLGVSSSDKKSALFRVV